MSGKRAYSADDLGRLFAVGVGPGDPDLMTLRAHDVLSKVVAVFAPKSKKDGESVALSIARGAVARGAHLRELHFPMSEDEGLLRPFWDKAAEEVLAFLRRGEDVAFVTLGDPSIYSTVGYLARAVLGKEADVTIEYVPGVTSFSAAAAKIGQALVEGDKPLAIVPTPAHWDGLSPAMKGDFGAVFMKAGRHLPALVETLREEGRLDGAVVASRVGLEGESIIRDLAKAEAFGKLSRGKNGSIDYLTLLLVPADGGGDDERSRRDG